MKTIRICKQHTAVWLGLSLALATAGLLALALVLTVPVWRRLRAVSPALTAGSSPARNSGAPPIAPTCSAET
jgi:hypothetical protein